MTPLPDGPCPCGSGRTGSDCCLPYLYRHRNPDTAEQLMRSRYTAYVLGLEEYLLATWHDSSRPERLGLADAAAVKWLGLRVLQVEGGRPQDSEGVVEFVARYKPGGRAERMHETSRFVRDGGRWFYLGGHIEST